MIQTDIARWAELSKKEDRPSWETRNDIIAALVPKDVSVLDIGCGNRDMQKLLPTCDYTALDCVGDPSNTIIMDFNTITDASEIDLDKVYDYAICSGVLEYIQNEWTFLQFVKRNSKNIILSYVLKSDRSGPTAMSKNGWVNEYTSDQLDETFERLNLKVVESTKYRTHTIFILQPTD